MYGHLYCVGNIASGRWPGLLGQQGGSRARRPLPACWPEAERSGSRAEEAQAAQHLATALPLVRHSGLLQSLPVEKGVAAHFQRVHRA